MDWNKWIIERLPRRLRVIGMFALCVILTSYVRRLYEDFVEWRRKQRIRMSGTPQVCQLKKIVHDELGVDIVIEEGDGKPIDFVIKTAFVNTDKERRLFALLDRYKLAGKSYGYENAEITIASTWSGYVCERALLEYGVKWTDFVCEQYYKINTITITYYWEYDSRWGSVIVKRISVQAKYPVKSELMVKCKLYLFDRHDQVLEPEFVLHSGESSISVDSWVVDLHTDEHIVGGDEYYEYRLKVEDIYE